MIYAGLVSVTFRKLPPERIVALVRQAGLRGIEWGGDIHVPHGELGRAREVGEITREAGLEVTAYGSYYRAARSEDEGLPFQQVLATALELGAPVVRVWAGTVGSAMADEEARWRVAADLRRIAGLAAKAGVRVATEFHGGTLTDTNESTNQLLLEADHPNLFTYWQPLTGMTDEICLQALGQLAPRLSHLHVFHWRTPQERLALAEGAARWKKFLAAARRAPGDRGAMLEFVPDDEPENFLRDAATLLAWLRETD
ncbi:MAG: sugar phosphate isomerase/epimerase [Opitutaceae bacterium]|nr:sugar phosphate isomerase/epimerase [Opitutaceae bacterium]